MRKFIALLSFLLSVLFITNCKTEQPKEKTVVGLYTPYNFFPDVLKGQVKAVKELNFWATNEGGEIVAGNPITIADRDTINWTNDFSVSFSPTGSVDESIYLDENAKATGSWKVTTKDDNLTTAAWIVDDTIRFYFNTVSKTESSCKMEYINAIADTLINSVEFKFDENGNYSTIQFYNFKNEPTRTFVYSYSPEGFLNGYTWSRKDTIRGGMNFTTNQQGTTETQEVYNKMTGTSSTYRYEYEYDEMGNWIKCVAFSDNKPEIVVKRSYTYY